MLTGVQKNKTKLIVLSAFLVSCLFFWFFVIKTPAYVVCIDSKTGGITKSKDEINKTIEKLKAEQEEKYNGELKLSSKIKIKRVFVDKDVLLNGEKLEELLRTSLCFQTRAAQLLVNGENIACFKSKDTAEKLLNDFKQQYSIVDEGENLVEVKFAEEIKIQEADVAVSQVLNYEDAFQLITTGTKNPEKYVVKEGDSLWWIARKNDMYVDDIVKANRMESEKIKPGQELILVKSKPYINVIASVRGEKDETIPYETEVIVDNNAPSSIRVKQYGQDGKKHINYVAEKVNGVIQNREITEEKVIKQAVNKVIVKGTKITQLASRSRSGTGAIDWPVYGPITQYYKGSRHTGLDIGGRLGTYLHAADSGYVTYVGYRGNYGNFVIIDHGNGMVTRYAHCNSFKVGVGQKVQKGDVIATMGSTGRSTGPHLHFEVLVNGSFRNPLDYLH